MININKLHALNMQELYGELPKDCGDDCTTVFWTKFGFIIFIFLEAFISGLIPTCSSSCRESPKVLGIANSFAAGVFLAIALMHILPEQSETWASLTIARKGPDAKIFPLAECVTFIGYTFILILDKVLFDTHALFNHEDDHDHNSDGPHVHCHDPAEKKLAENVKASMSKHEELVGSRTASKQDVKASLIESQEGIAQGIKEYLNPNERFA